MFLVRNKTAATVYAGPLALLAYQQITVPFLNTELNDAIAQGTVEVITFEQTTRMYDWASAQAVTVDAAQHISTAINAPEVMLHASTGLYIKVGAGPNPGTAGATAGCVPLSAGEKFHLQIVPGQMISVTRQSVDGILYIVPVKNA